MQRNAKCQCGDLEITVQGDPSAVLVCSCENCQRRTGSAFGMGAYFNDDQIVDVQGQTKTFQYASDSGKKISTTFCTNCGTTVFWAAEFQTGLTGIAVGCFNDPDFPEPKVSYWNNSKLKWVSFPDHWHELAEQSFSKNTK